MFKLKKKTIATDEKTKLKVRLNTASTLKVVLKSKHQHVVKGKKKYLKVVLTKRLPAGTSKITIKGKKLAPDTWKLVGTAKNTTGHQPEEEGEAHRGPSRQGLDSGHLEHPGEGTWRRGARRQSQRSTGALVPRIAGHLPAAPPRPGCRSPLVRSGSSDQAAASRSTRRQRDGRVARQQHGPLVLPPGRWHVVARTLSAPGVDSLFPEVVVTPDGAATVVWTRDDPSGLVLQFATRQGGGAWSAPADVFSAYASRASSPWRRPGGHGTVVYLHPRAAAARPSR